MAKNSYLEQGDAGFSKQLVDASKALPGYATVLGVAPAQVTGLAADSAYFSHTVDKQTVLQNATSQITAWKRIIRDGGNLPPTGAPVAPVLPADVPAVDPGIEPRFRALVRQIKASGGYNEAIGKALGIEGSEKGGTDLVTIAPSLTATHAGGKVEIGWGWQGHGDSLDLIEIHVDRGSGYALLTYDTTPGYTDTTPLPATPVKWTYKAIYRVGDGQVGQWSAEASVTVGG